MFFTPLNLVKELTNQKQSDADIADKLVADVQNILSREAEEEERILDNASLNDVLQRYDESLLKEDRIFSAVQIRNLCIKYRLRFLDFKHFQGELPYEAVIKLKQLEKKLNKPLGRLKIVAPSSLFKLMDKDSDPLLMLSLGKGRYYFIHQWGNDLRWHRKWIAWPFRTINHFMATLVISAMLFAQLVPIGTLPDVDNIGVFSIYRLYLFAFTLICFCSLSVFLLFTLRKNFSDQEWKNAYI